MDFLWAIIVILVIFFVLFAVLPSLMSTPPPPPLHAIQSPTHPITQPSTPASRYQAQTAASKAMLDTQYQQARSAVPENYPRKPIGECPYSKAPSMDLPLSNVPMCVAKQPDNMRLPNPNPNPI